MESPLILCHLDTTDNGVAGWMIYNLLMSDCCPPSTIRSELCRFSQGIFHLRSLTTMPKCYPPVISLGCGRKTTWVTFKPTLGWTLTLPTREGSLRCLMTDNRSKNSSINAHRSDSYKIGLNLKILVGQA
jgi:hypothetical protein